MRWLLLFVLLFLVTTTNLIGQEQPDWVLKIPKYFRLKGGSSTLINDNMRKAIMFDGGAYDTYVTYDGGNTWETIFDMKMFFIDVATYWNIDDVGRWFYTGNVYLKNTINLVSEDAGKTLRYLVKDSTTLPIAYRDEIHPRLVRPNALILDVYGYSIENDGIYATCDAGISWSKKVRPGTLVSTDVDLITVSPGMLAYPDPNGFAMEYRVCDTGFVRQDFLMDNPYFHFSDGTILKYNDYWEFEELGFKIRKPNDSTFSYTEKYWDPHSGSMQVFQIEQAGLINDTSALLIGRYGVVAQFNLKFGVRMISTPPRFDRHQRVVAVGKLGDRVLLQTHVPANPSSAGVVWTLLNMRTGDVKTFERITTNPDYGLDWFSFQPFSNQKIMPFADSTWIASLRWGELMKTTDAGRTWTLVNNIVQDDRWGTAFVGISRLFVRSDNSVALLTDGNRLMTSNDGRTNWTITHNAPFVHKITSPNVVYSQTNSSTGYVEDFNSLYRMRYGPSTTYFQADDTLWTSGDVVKRFTTDGQFVDTLLNRKCRYIKRLDDNRVVVGMDSVYYTYNNGDEWYFINADWPRITHGPNDTARAALGDLVIAADGSMIAGLRGVRNIDTLGNEVDSIPGGIIRSTDNGSSWRRITPTIQDNKYVSSILRLSTGTLLCMASEVHTDCRFWDDVHFEWRRRKLSEIRPEQIHLGQSHVYRSDDNGREWKKVFVFPDRDKLTTTDIRLVHMPDGRIMAIHPQYGIAISADDGKHWAVADPFGIGIPEINDVVFTPDGWAHLATNLGYVKVRVDNITSVEQNGSASNGLNVHYQNGVLHLFTDIEPTSVEIYTLDGTLVHAEKSASPIHSLALNSLASASLASGTYLVRASSISNIASALMQINN